MDEHTRPGVRIGSFREGIGHMDIRSTVFKLLRGAAAAALCTLPGMALLALMVVLVPVEDSTLSVLNQLLKAISVFVGAFVAVGRGGSRGFVTGAAVGLIYMLAGYSLYCALDGSAGAWAMLGGEALFGALIGAVSGAICANMKPARRRRAA